MSLESSKIAAKQESLDTTVTDLARIVGKLDQKMDDYQQENRKAISELKSDNAEIKQCFKLYFLAKRYLTSGSSG